MGNKFYKKNPFYWIEKVIKEPCISFIFLLGRQIGSGIQAIFGQFSLETDNNKSTGSFRRRERDQWLLRGPQEAEERGDCHVEEAVAQQSLGVTLCHG